MLYFEDFKTLLYNFGNEVDPVVFQDIYKYADVVDQIKDNLTFFNLHFVQEGFRPDQVSIQLYGTPLYYWTFYLLNDDIRQQGWPLIRSELETYTKKLFPNTVLTTRNDIASKLKVGQIATGVSSGASGKIIRRNLNLGQIVVEGTVGFRIGGENINSTNADGDLETIFAVSSANEYQSESHYIDGSGTIVDIDPHVGPGALLTGKTFEEVYFDVNESLRTIKIIKPSLMSTVISGYKKAIKS